MAADRKFALREKMALEIRGDFFNIVNHGNWNNPALAITSATFGQITTFSTPRIIQLSAKFLF